MKILKIFGIVVGIHVFALILIFANPGCSSTNKSAPSPGETAAPPDAAAPVVSAPSAPSSVYSSTTDSSTSAPPVTFNPNVPAGAAPVASSDARYSPTRPGSPAAGTLKHEPITDVTPVTTYTVKSGDNLWTIARKHNLTVAQLTSANSLTTSASLRPGQKLIIPGKPTAPTIVAPATGGAPAPAKSDPLAAATARPANEALKHTVQSGETLGGIARKYDVRQGDIAVANNIADPKKIRPGMELIIPGGWKAPASKSSKSPQKSTNGSAKSTPPATPAATPPIDPAPPTPVEPAPTPAPAVPVIRLDDAPPPKQP